MDFYPLDELQKLSKTTSQDKHLWCLHQVDCILLCISNVEYGLKLTKNEAFSTFRRFV